MGPLGTGCLSSGVLLGPVEVPGQEGFGAMLALLLLLMLVLVLVLVEHQRC